MTKVGFKIKLDFHPTGPIMISEAKVAQDMAADCLKEGICVIGFNYPVVPRRQARTRVQVSVSHTVGHLDKAIRVFTKVGKSYGIIP